MAFDRETSWAGGGSWDPPDPPPEPTEPAPAPPPKRPSVVATSLPTLKPSGKRAGLVCGRFAPLHRGHQMLIQFARESVDSLTVLVFTPQGETIPAAVRVAWIRALFPDVTVAHAGDYPDPAAPDFGARFAAACASWQPAGERSLFTSDESGRIAAEALSAKLVFVDPGRVLVPISATKLRRDPMENFDFLAAPARSAFVRRIALVGAESTGKSTLCRAFAEAYDTTWVPEQARVVAEAQGGLTSTAAIEEAARLQIAEEERLAATANRLLFCDTNSAQLVHWHARLFGTPAPAWMLERAQQDAYDAVIICKPDVPFVGAPERDQPAARAAFHEALVQDLGRTGTNSVQIGGSFEERRRIARGVIDEVVRSRELFAARTYAVFTATMGKL